MREVLSGCLSQVEGPVGGGSMRGGLHKSELVSPLADLETGGAEGTVLFPSTQAQIHLRVQPFPLWPWS